MVKVGSIVRISVGEILKGCSIGHATGIVERISGSGKVFDVRMNGWPFALSFERHEFIVLQ